MDNFMTSRQGWQKDISAGITVGVVAVPLAMAFAIASGVGPVYGLYTAIIAGILVSLFGGSTFQIAGPTGAFIPIVSGVMLAHGYEGLLVTTFLAGILLFLMSVLRVGRLIRFMPRAVTIGFTAGIAVVIFVDQLDELFGITFEKAPHFHENLLKLVTSLHEASLWPIFIAAIGFLTLWLVPKLPVKLPLLLMAMLVPTFVSLVIPGEVATIGSAYGGIPSGLPEFNWLAIDLDLIATLLPSAFAIAFLGALESLLSGAVADGMAGTKMNPDKELFGQGLANVVVPFFGGIPATGAIARTATNIQAGAVSRRSGVIHGLTVLLAVLVLAPLASYVPLAALAPILMRVAWNMSERHHVFEMLRHRSAESLVLLITLGLTVFVDLVVAVEVGVICALALFAKRMADTIDVREQTERYVTRDGQVVFSVEGPLFFGAIEMFEHVLHHIHDEPDVFIFNFHRCPVIDVTAVEEIRRVVRELKAADRRVVFAHLSAPVRQTLAHYGVLDDVDTFDTTQEAIDAS